MHPVRKDGGAKEISQRRDKDATRSAGSGYRTATKKLSKRGPRFDLLSFINLPCQGRSSGHEGHRQ